jgi:DNA (cytosine-5)-methyltransferase 1
MPSFYEFFAGGGMARAGLGRPWACLFANDIDPKKGAAYAANWGTEEFLLRDVASLSAAELPGKADLAWGSFPCQDLSLAGSGAGLHGKRSGTFWPFWGLITALRKEDRAPEIVVLENVCGALSSHGGKDFAAIGSALAGSRYQFGAVVIDAVRFVPQSRPRLFIIAIQNDIAIPDAVKLSAPDPTWHPLHLVNGYEKLSREARSSWVWWKLPIPSKRSSIFADLIDDAPQGVTWHTTEETQRLLDMMSPINRRKVEQAKRLGHRVVGGIYRRTRTDKDGGRVQRAEVRFDDISGCLRTPAGGSSRQTILLVEGEHIRSRLLSPREAARLMGLPDAYTLPANYNDAYHLAGDGVVVPVVRFLSNHLLEPLLTAVEERKRQAA